MPSPRAGQRHEWDRNKPKIGWATCAVCGMEIKEYKIRRGGLMSCQEFLDKKAHQSKLEECIEEDPPCMVIPNFNPIVACFSCPGRLSAKKCEAMRHNYGLRLKKKTSNLESPMESPQSIPA